MLLAGSAAYHLDIRKRRGHGLHSRRMGNGHGHRLLVGSDGNSLSYLFGNNVAEWAAVQQAFITESPVPCGRVFSGSQRAEDGTEPPAALLRSANVHIITIHRRTTRGAASLLLVSRRASSADRARNRVGGCRVGPGRNDGPRLGVLAVIAARPYTCPILLLHSSSETTEVVAEGLDRTSWSPEDLSKLPHHLAYLLTRPRLRNPPA
ncbi:hypothetical protein HPB51_015970 [Rhipicephalus microplus]|uniref:Uncharacterized protein n=1 Tax=Rhipicephalus microplus TaxID=6941 RepID=A0A9J6DI49_RHIMP|nr:hypothetical protein HPB51_015970 [Rhipicephalus microplus]